MKRLMIIFILLIPITVYASEDSIINYVDEYNLDNMIDYNLEIFDGFDIKTIQKQLIEGEGFDSGDIIKKLIVLFFAEFKAYYKLFIILIISGFVISAGTGNALLENKNKDAVQMVGYCLYAIILCNLFIAIVQPVKDYMESMAVAGKTLYTVLIGITYARGGAVTGMLMNTSLLVMVNVFIDIFNKVLIPLLISSVMISVADNFSGKIKITSLAVNLRSITKWILIFILSLYTGIFSIYGVAGSGVDQTIRKAAKMAVGTMFPVVGGVVADSMETVGAVLKGVSGIVGVSGIIVIVFYAVMPIIKLMVLRWGIKLCVVVLEPVASSQIIKLSENICECITYVFAIVVSGTLLLCASGGILLMAGNCV